MNLLLVGLGGGAGAMCRYLVSLAALRTLGTGFAWGTFAVNLLGSFALAFLATWGPASGGLSPELRLALGTGFMGGFTTYSTFSYETLGYLQSGETHLAAANVLLTVLVCLAACWLGVTAAQSLTP